MNQIPPKLHLESYGVSDTGLVRPNNEDVWEELPEHNFYVLADGMGGHKAGEIAAREAASHLCKEVAKFLSGKHKYSEKELTAKLHDAIVSTNAWVYRLAEQNEELSDMGTTLCCFLLYGETLFYGHVGDSRIYRYRDGLERLTQDHSLRQELIKKGFLSEKMAPHFPFKNIITRTIGTHATVEPEMGRTLVSAKDLYLLCSDGLTDPVSDEEMAEILAKAKTVKEACTQLIDAAKQGGGSDNITLVMIKILPN